MGFGSARAGTFGAPLVGDECSVNACGSVGHCVVQSSMDDGALSTALERAERALERIDRALADRRPTEGRDEELRAKVREVVEELDELIREVAA